MTDLWVGPAGSESSGEVTVQNMSTHELPGIENLLEPVPVRTLDLEGQGLPGQIAIVLTTDQQLQALHDRHLNDDSPTDVMTFPYSSGDEAVSGDIVISVDRAQEQAMAEGWSLQEELVFIAIHGMLHLCGWDDHDTDDRDRMLARQREIMSLLDRPE